MTKRYECVDAVNVNPKLVGPGVTIGYDEVAEHALILGDPDATALYIVGDLDQLRQLVGQILTVVAHEVSVVADTPAAAHAVEQLRAGQERAMA